MKSSLLYLFVLALTAKYDYVFGTCSLGYKPKPGQKYDECHGKYQSPVNIDTKKVKYSSSLGDIKFVNYDDGLTWNFTNTGHTIVANKAYDASQYDTPAIYLDENSDEPFYLVQFHFHWGKDLDEGSEHTINKRKFPLELHLVHNSTSGKLAVLGFLFTATTLLEIKLTKRNNPRINSLIDMVQKDQNEEDYSVGLCSLKEMLPDFEKSNRQGYFRYIGSLTTPPCTEGIIWTIFERVIPISSKQLKCFHETSVPPNYRAPQRKFKRQILSNNRKYLVNN